MTRGEAEQRCEQLNRERAGEQGLRWLAQELPGGEWRAVSVRLAGQVSTRPWKATVEQQPRQEEPLDPRPPIIRNVPPHGPPGF